jgi:amino acid adenylation domain-containing protein
MPADAAPNQPSVSRPAKSPWPDRDTPRTPDDPLVDLLAQLAAKGVRLQAEGQRLRCHAPPGVLTAPLLDQLRARKADILRELTVEAAPLALMQERLWLAHQLDPTDSAYHLPLQLELSGPLRPVGLRHALAETVRRHEVLRSGFPAVDGWPRQRINPFGPPTVRLVDLTHLPPAARSVARRDLAAAEAARPFDLGVGPPLRMSLVALDQTTHDVLLTRHHIASDGWSFGILADELRAGYTAAHRGVPARLTELPWQFADFARWQRGVVHTDDTVRAIARWRHRLADATRDWDLLPATPDTITGPAGTAFRDVDTALAEAVRRTARQTGTTPFTVLLTAFGLTVTSASGQRELVIGTPANGRVRAETASLVGCFATVLPLWLDYRGDPTFAAAIRHVHTEVRHALAQQDLPVEQVIEMPRSDRAVGRPALFPVVFTLQDTEVAHLDLPGVTAAVADPVAVAAKFPFSITVTALDGRYRVLAEYDRTRLAVETAHAMLDRFIRLLALASENPKRHCVALVRSAVPPSARRWPAPSGAIGAVDIDTEASLGSRFAAVATRVPAAIAVTAQEGSVSYAVLHRRALCLAMTLRSVGVTAETPVAVCVEHSIGLVVALLAVALAGGFAVPVDPDDPPARHEVIFADSGAGVLVADRRQAVELRWFDGHVLVVDGPAAATQPGPWCRLPDVVADQLAYVAYTSGTSGRPKGVMVTHRNVLALFTAADRALGLTAPGLAQKAAQTWSLCHSSAFDFSIWELWGPLLRGDRVVVLPRDTVRDPAELLRTIQAQQVTLHSSTPTAFARLLPEIAAGRFRPTVVLGGERCEPHTLRAWFGSSSADDHDDGAAGQLVNMYGITETTVHVTYRVLHRADTEIAVSPIGSPLPGASVAVIDADGAPVLPGGHGELIVAGWGVARGYLGKPGLTAERFGPAADGAREYFSGDRVRLLPHGELAYIDRIDQQIKLSGYRFQPAEVEVALASHPQVAAAAVTTTDDHDGRRRLIAYVVPAPRAPGVPNATALRRHLSALLPAYMVPTVFLALRQLPLTRNGKLDYGALPAPGADVAAAAHQPPASATEIAIAALWCELLRVPAVSRQDDFLVLGGDSLLVTRLHTRLQATFGVSLSLREVYQRPDLASLAAAVDRALAAIDRGTQAR